MKVAKATHIIFVFWLLASIYWNDSHRVCSPTLHDCHIECYTSSNKLIRNHGCILYSRFTEIDTLKDKPLNSHKNISTIYNCYIECYITNCISNRNNDCMPCLRNNNIMNVNPLTTQYNTFFLVISPLQAPLVDKWNGEIFRVKRRISMVTKSNMKQLCLCRMTLSRSLDRTFDGVKDMETSQNKKRSSSNACLAVIEKNKNKNVPKKNSNLWLGFKAMNALNESRGCEEVAHKSVSELVKLGMSEKEALECQDCVPSYPFVPQGI